MSLPTGARLGSYQVHGLIGRGGMGEVYRARDTKLGRDVAIKVLPEAFAGNPERLARFRREAQVLASLNHPNIAQIYGLDDANDTTMLVMELVEGPTLAELIETSAHPARRNPQGSSRQSRGLPVPDAMALARQVAEALEAAHERGIVHRDLKPANVKVKADGTVKVLDFGLAKALVADAANAAADDATSSPTLTSPDQTAMGLLLGTAAYMAPEQARGRPVDKRADIWAFGCVLYEMLTGRRAFEGDDVLVTLSGVLQRDPDWTSLPAATPRAVRQLLLRCLEKEARRRLRDIGEARLVLEGAPGESDHQVAPLTRSWPRSAQLTVGIGLVAVAAAAYWLGQRAGVEEQQAVPFSSYTRLTDAAGEEMSPSISPDGLSFAFASRARGSWDINVQRIGGRNPTVIGEANRDEASPAFSPDGGSVAFHEVDVDGGIFVVGATGESPRRLTTEGFHPAWSPDGRRIVFSSELIRTPYSRQTTSTISMVTVSGEQGTGRIERVFEGDGAQPAWSPSGARIAFWSNREGQRDIWTIPARGGQPVPATDDMHLDWNPVWSPDGRFLVFSSDRGGSMNLWRIAIDESSGRPLGQPEPVTLGVSVAMSAPSFSRDGKRLLLQSTLQSMNPVALSFDPARESIDGYTFLFRRSGILIPTDVSPTGEWLALSNAGERQEDVFIARTDGTELMQVTDSPARDRGAVWSRPDGNQLAYYSNEGGNYDVWVVDRDGFNRRQASESGDLIQPNYSPMGDRIAASAARGIHVFDPRRPWKEQEVQIVTADRPGLETSPVWSPDGRRLAIILSGASATSASLAVVDAASGKTEAVASNVPALAMRWLSATRLLSFTLDSELLLYDIDTSRVKKLELPAGLRVAGGGLAIAPDGRTIYTTALERESDIWLAEFPEPADD